jgi:hypothetical protein
VGFFILVVEWHMTNFRMMLLNLLCGATIVFVVVALQKSGRDFSSQYLK